MTEQRAPGQAVQPRPYQQPPGIRSGSGERERTWVTDSLSLERPHAGSPGGGHASGQINRRGTARPNRTAYGVDRVRRRARSSVVRPLPHGYTNRMLGDGGRVVKTYQGPDAAERMARERHALVALAGNLPVPVRRGVQVGLNVLLSGIQGGEAATAVPTC